MKASLRAGLVRTNRLVIDKDRTTGHMGDDLRVYSTSSLVRDVEHVCRELLLDHCDSAEDSVGAEINLRHSAPTLLGMEVEITATVLDVQGRKVTFEFTAKDGVDPIGGGSHVRFLVDVSKSPDRLRAKAAKRDAARAGSR